MKRNHHTANIRTIPTYRTVVKGKKEQLITKKKSLKGWAIHVFTRPKNKIETGIRQLLEPT